MLIDYIQAAMRRAKYQMLADNEGFVGTIPGFRGLIGHARSLEKCREDLHGALQAWMLLKLLHRDHDLPVIDGINLISSKIVSNARKKRRPRKAA